MNIEHASFFKARGLETYVSDILLMRCFKFQFCSSDGFIFNLVYVSSGLLQAFPLRIPTHTCNNSRRSCAKRPMKPLVFYDCFKILCFPHFCLSLVHRGRFYEIESRSAMFLGVSRGAVLSLFAWSTVFEIFFPARGPVKRTRGLHIHLCL